MFALAKGFAGIICDICLNVLCWSAAQHNMQCVADMAPHRSYRAAYSAAATQVKSAMTKVTLITVDMALAPVTGVAATGVGVRVY